MPSTCPLQNALNFPGGPFAAPVFRSCGGPTLPNYGAIRIGGVIGMKSAILSIYRGQHVDGQARMRKWWTPGISHTFSRLDRQTRPLSTIPTNHLKTSP